MLFRRTVFLIRLNVILFSIYYIIHEIFNKRFLILVNIFILSINFLIFIPNIIILLIGWDGLGITSFLLVIYYYNISSLRSGLITMFINRLGDVFLLLRIRIILNSGNWYYVLDNNKFVFFLSLLLLICRCTKSAQFPFRCWLPAAIAAPTPVRALVHSSTLVTAGIFLVIRFYDFIFLYFILKFYLIVIGCLTILIAGVCAIIECDIKKIIALSTLSQLGVMIISVGIGYPMLAYFHLIIHALFKALLFLCAGTLIHLFNHGQDLRYLGRIINQLPLSLRCIIISNLSLCGFPFIRGFFSKDLLIEYRLNSISIFFLYFMYIIGALLTCLYSIRFLLYCSLISNHYIRINSLLETNKFNLIPIVILSFFSIIGGGVINWFIFPFKECFISFFIKNFLFILLVFFFFLYINFRKLFIIVWKKRNFFIFIFNNIIFLNYISGQIIIYNIFKFTNLRLVILDQGWYELLGPKGFYNYFSSLSIKLFNFQLKFIIRNFLFFIFIFIIFIY